MKRYRWWLLSVVLLAALSCAVGFVWSLSLSLRSVVKVADEAVLALFRGDLNNLGKLTRCDACAARIHRKWRSIIDRQGKLRSWQFKRVVLIFDWGSRISEEHADHAGHYSVEYRLSFGKNREATVSLEIADSDDGYRVCNIDEVKVHELKFRFP